MKTSILKPVPASRSTEGYLQPWFWRWFQLQKMEALKGISDSLTKYWAFVLASLILNELS